MLHRFRPLRLPFLSHPLRFVWAVFLLALGTAPFGAFVHAQHFSDCLTQQDTGTSATIVLPGDVSSVLPGQSVLESGDEVAVYTDTGTCAGRAVWPNDGSNVALAAAGPNQDPSASITGFAEGEPLTYRVYDASRDQEYDLGTIAEYIDCGSSDVLCRDDGLYATGTVITLSTLGGTAALPVELAAFTATRSESRAVLEWRTLTETSNAEFTIEHRAPNRTAWTSLGTREGQGTTNRPHDYRFTTQALAPGTHRFRLVQTDLDGTSTPSDPVLLRITLNEPAVVSSIAPHPIRSTGQLTVQVRDAQPVTVAVYNLLGQRVQLLHDGPLAPGTPLRLHVRADALASGIYLVRVQGQRFTKTQRAVVVR